MNDPRDTRRLRAIAFEGTRNFRDLGGIPTPAGTTRYGAVYRSDRLSNLTDADGVRLRELGIATIIDMRTSEERERAPNRLPKDFAVKQVARAFLPRHTLPMFDAINSGEYDAATTYDTMLKQYEALALEHTEDYRHIIEVLLEPGNVPAIIHCTSGKDRTGMVAAIILLALEAPQEAIVADYTLTQGRIEKVDYFADTADQDAIDIVMAAKPDYITAAFNAMESGFGSVAGYLREAVGITPEKQQLLRALLIDD